MNVTVKLALTETDRRTIRAAMGRGGQATRSDVRTFVDRAYREALGAAPEPKRARVPFDAPAASTRPGRLAAAEAAPADALCRHCGRPKAIGHGRMGFSCLPLDGVPKGSVFEAAPEPTLSQE